MQIIQVHVDGQMFILDSGHDTAALKQKIVTAAREGADFVDFDTVGRGQISVLITSTIPVRFESIDRSAEQLSEWQDNPPTIDGHLDVETYLNTSGI